VLERRSNESAERYLAQRPEPTGETLPLAQATNTARRDFGGLLETAPRANQPNRVSARG